MSNNNKGDNLNREFRKFDVDLYNEDNYKEELDNEDSSSKLDINQINNNFAWPKDMKRAFYGSFRDIEVFDSEYKKVENLD